MRPGIVVAAAALIVPSASYAQQFGAAATVAGDQLVISEPVLQDRPATLYLFSRAGSGWTSAGSLNAPQAGGTDFFGRFVAGDDSTLAVGATSFDNSTGAVWIYRREGSGWALAQTIRPEDVVQGDSFGRVGLMSGDLLFVTSLGHGDGRGAVWVFRRGADGEWTRESRLEPGPEAAPREFMGWSLAFDGERLLAGALQGGQELQNRGAVYLFRRNAPGDWSLESRLSMPEDESEPGDRFGSAVAWLDGQALIGAPGRDGGVGEVRSYHSRGEAWVPGVTLSAHDRLGGNRFGSSIVVGDGELLIGAPGSGLSGRVYRIAHDPESNDFGEVGKLAPREGDAGDDFGATLSLVGNVVIVGATGDDMGLGTASVFERSGDDWLRSATLSGIELTTPDAITGGDVVCRDGQADQFTCHNVDILSFLPLEAIGAGRGARTNDVWGWTHQESGREFAIVGRTDGTAFLEVTDPANPRYLGNLPKTPGTRSNVWRDIKVYHDHAYVVADGAGPHGVQVFDLTRLLSVAAAPVTFTVDALYDGIGSAHNIVINEETGYAYAVGVNSGGETCGGGLHMIDIRTPERPTFIGCYADSTTGRAGTGYTHDAQCIVYHGPDSDYGGREVCFGANETALSISDVSDKSHPVQISSATYPNVGYAHQGWVTEDHRYYLSNDEADEINSEQAGAPLAGSRTLVWDVQDLDDPVLVKEHFGEAFSVDHNFYIRDGLMYQSNNSSGLRILDVSDPENPREVGFFDPGPWDDAVGFNGTWSNYPYFPSGTIVVSSRREGVFLLRYQPQDLVP